MRFFLILIGGCAILSACGPRGAASPEIAQRAELSSIDVHAKLPQAAPEGTCWGTDITPAQFETVTERKLVSPAGLSADGSSLTDAIYATETRQRVVRERQEVWFQIPCERDLTPDAIASLQRALAARGLFAGPPTADMDTATRTAIRQYQAPRGLDSSVLSLEAARSLGLAAVALPAA